MEANSRGQALYRNAYQRGLLSIFFAGGQKPFLNWDQKVQYGYINRYLDPELKELVVEIGGTNVSTTYATCPKRTKDVLGIRMPFLVMVVKNLKKYFTFEVTVLDNTGYRRKFRVANFQTSTKITPMHTAMPIGLAEGWNQIQFNLSDFTSRAYKTEYQEAVKIQINANIIVRRIYFADKLVPEQDLPDEYKLFFPLSSKSKFKVPPIEQCLCDEEKPYEKCPCDEDNKENMPLLTSKQRLSVLGGDNRSRVLSPLTSKQRLPVLGDDNRSRVLTSVSQQSGLRSTSKMRQSQKSNLTLGKDEAVSQRSLAEKDLIESDNQEKEAEGAEDNVEENLKENADVSKSMEQMNLDNAAVPASATQSVTEMEKTASAVEQQPGDNDANVIEDNDNTALVNTNQSASVMPQTDQPETNIEVVEND